MSGQGVDEREQAWAASEPADGTFQFSKVVPGYERLMVVLDEAYQQAAVGKGAERHGQDLPFEHQPMQQISRLLDTDGGMAYQAIKKIQEARRLPTVERQKRELLGAINYLAGMVIYLEDKPGE